MAYKKDLDSLLQKEALPRLVFLYGESDFLLARYGKILQRYWEKREADVMVMSFDEYRFETAKSHLSEPSLFNDMTTLMMRSDTKILKKEVETLSKLVQTHKNTSIVYISSLESKEAKEYEKYFKEGVCIRFFEPSLFEAKQLLLEEAKQKNLQLNENLLLHLYHLCGQNIALSFAELDKLTILDTPLDIGTLERLVYGLESRSGDDLVVALIHKKGVETIAENLLEQGLDPIEIVTGMERYFYQLLLFVMAMKTEGTLSSSQSVLGYMLPKNLFEERLMLCRKIPFQLYEKILGDLLECENRMKSAKDDKHALFFATLLSLKKILT